MRAHLYARVPFTVTISHKIPFNFREIPTLVRSKVKENVAIIIVENLNEDWIATLGTVLNIDPVFFREHTLSSEGGSPWKAVFQPGQRRVVESQANKNTLPGALAVSLDDPRTIFNNKPWPTNVFDNNPWHVDGVFESGRLHERLSQRGSVMNPNHAYRQTAFDSRVGWTMTTRISHYRTENNIGKIDTRTSRLFLDSC